MTIVTAVHAMLLQLLQHCTYGSGFFLVTEDYEDGSSSVPQVAQKIHTAIVLTLGNTVVFYCTVSIYHLALT